MSGEGGGHRIDERVLRVGIEKRTLGDGKIEQFAQGGRLILQGGRHGWGTVDGRDRQIEGIGYGGAGRVGGGHFDANHACRPVAGRTAETARIAVEEEPVR